MIYTVTFNPSLDYIVTVEAFCGGALNRTRDERLTAGGKGVNVSLVLKNLGMESRVLGFCAGFTGAEIERLLRSQGCVPELIRLDEGVSRINVKLRSGGGETEINARGPQIPARKLDALFAKLEALKEGDVLVLAGSIPDSLPPTVYADILERLAGRGCLAVADASGELLRSVLPYRPFLVKPNHYELGALFGVTLSTREAVIPYARRLQEQGARNVLVSMADKGAVLVSGDGQVLLSPALAGDVKNSVGAGDSMVAGFLYGYLNTGDYVSAFETGLCAGSASAFSDELATSEAVAALRREQAGLTVTLPQPPQLSTQE